MSDQARASKAVQATSPELEEAVKHTVARLKGGGRLIYAGAGASGRLALLDAAELPPTFSWPVERAVTMFAGGSKAAVTAAEEAEDDMAQGASDARNLGVGPLDVLIGVSASGTTRYVIGALQAARQAGAYTITMINNRRGAFEALPHCVVVLDTGAEVITGSTRLKAGTAQKITLSIFSTAVMVGLGKAFGNLMVDVKPNNHKLRERSVWLIMAATGADEHTARTTLELAQGQLKAAIVMLRLQVSASAARQRLTAMNGQLRDALAHA